MTFFLKPSKVFKKWGSIIVLKMTELRAWAFCKYSGINCFEFNQKLKSAYAYSLECATLNGCQAFGGVCGDLEIWRLPPFLILQNISTNTINFVQFIWLTYKILIINYNWMLNNIYVKKKRVNNSICKDVIKHCAYNKYSIFYPKHTFLCLLWYSSIF